MCIETQKTLNNHCVTSYQPVYFLVFTDWITSAVSTCMCGLIDWHIHLFRKRCWVYLWDQYQEVQQPWSDVYLHCMMSNTPVQRQEKTDVPTQRLSDRKASLLLGWGSAFLFSSSLQLIGCGPHTVWIRWFHSTILGCSTHRRYLIVWYSHTTEPVTLASWEMLFQVAANLQVCLFHNDPEGKSNTRV